MKRAEGWELSFLSLFKRAFFYGWEGEEGGDAPSFQKGFLLWVGREEGGDAPSIPKGFFFLLLRKGNGEVFLFKCGDLFNEGLFLD